MGKTHFYTLVVSQVKIIYCLLAALGLLTISVLDLLELNFHFAAISAGFALGLLFYAGYLLWARNKKSPSPIPEWLLVSLLWFFTLFGMQQSTQVAHWVYFVPLYTFFLIPFRWASTILVLYSLMLVLVILQRFGIEQRSQILFTYVSCFTFSFVYALINERNNKRLSEISNSDPVTQVFNEIQLASDIKIEINRADRQCSPLKFFVVTVPSVWRSEDLGELEVQMLELGKKLRKSLRPYDSCYRLDSNDFVILMPQTNEEDAYALQEEILKNSVLGKHSNLLTMQLVTYQANNDDATSLLTRIKGVLHAH